MRARLLCAGSHEEERRVDDVVCEEDEDDDEMKKRSDKVEWYTNVNLDHTQTELGALTTKCRCFRLSCPP